MISGKKICTTEKEKLNPDVFTHTIFTKTEELDPIYLMEMLVGEGEIISSIYTQTKHTESVCGFRSYLKVD